MKTLDWVKITLGKLSFCKVSVLELYCGVV